jgi:hypothetical protein
LIKTLFKGRGPPTASTISKRWSGRKAPATVTLYKVLRWE